MKMRDSRNGDTPVSKGGRPPNADGEATRQRILREARACFAEFGYADANNRMIAERSGLTTAALYHHREGPNSFSLGATGAGGEAFEEVVTRTLFQVVREETALRLGLIKLDVEGCEELVLRGAISIIVRHHPTVLFEMNGTAAARLGLRPFGSWKLLESLGYGFFSLTERGELCELNQPPAGNDAINVVAIHRMERT